MTYEEAKIEARAIRKATEEEKARHEKAFEEFRARWTSLRKVCPHDGVIYFSVCGYEPGGYECEVCRAEFRDKPPKSRVVD